MVDGRQVIVDIRPEHFARGRGKAGFRPADVVIDRVQTTGTRTNVQFLLGGTRTMADPSDLVIAPYGVCRPVVTG